MDWIKKQFSFRPRKVAEAFQALAILLIAFPAVVIGAIFLFIWVFTDYWRALVACSLGVGFVGLHIADQDPPPAKSNAVKTYRVVNTLPPGAAPAAVQKAPEPKSQEEKDKLLELAEMQRDHWHKISMFLLGLAGILVTALGLLLRSAWPTK